MFGKLRTYRNLEVHELIGKSRHLIIEAEAVFANVVCSEDEVALSLLLALHDDTLAWADDGVVNIKGSSRLNLGVTNVSLSCLFLKCFHP
jgi:hypothetical protein